LVPAVAARGEAVGRADLRPLRTDLSWSRCRAGRARSPPSGCCRRRHLGRCGAGRCSAGRVSLAPGAVLAVTRTGELQQFWRNLSGNDGGQHCPRPDQNLFLAGALMAIDARCGLTPAGTADSAGHHWHSGDSGGWGTAAVVQRWQTWRGGQQVLEDFKEAQARAERGGGFVFSGGGLVTAKSFLVFEPEARRYALYDWHDADGDGQPEDGESRRIWTASCHRRCTSAGLRGSIARRAVMLPATRAWPSPSVRPLTRHAPGARASNSISRGSVAWGRGGLSG